MPTPYEDPSNQALVAEISQRISGEIWELTSAMAFFRAAKVIASADGLSTAESDAIGRMMHQLGIPEYFCQEIVDFDATAASVEDVLAHSRPGSRQARTLLAFAINVASVDGFGESEREAARIMAAHLGVRVDLVDVLAASARVQHLAAAGDGGLEALEAALALQRAIIDFEG